MINLPHMSSGGIAKTEEASRGTAKFLKLAPSVIGIVVCVVVVTLVIWPKFNQVMKLRSENDQLTQRAEALASKAKLLSSFSQEQLENRFLVSEKLLPSDKAVFSMVSLVEKAASSSGVIVNKIDLVPGAVTDNTSAAQVGGVVNAPPVQGESGTLGVDTPRIQIKVAITSDYQSALRFLNTLVAAQRAISLSDLSIASGSSSEGGNVLKTTLVVNAFWKPLPLELPAIEAPVADISEPEAALLDKVASIIEGTTSADVPKVPLGRSDLFAPF